jgi:WD40 repeat protein
MANHGFDQLGECVGEGSVSVVAEDVGVPMEQDGQRLGEVSNGSRFSDQWLSVAFSRDGELLASGSADRIVKVWDARTWKLLHNLHDPH